MLSFEPGNYLGKDIKGVAILEEIGHGSMGAVYTGYQRSLKRKVAVKILPKQCIWETSVRLRFRDEAETVAVLSHPNLIPVFDMGETDEVLFQISQLIEGDNLRSCLRNRLMHPVPGKRLYGIVEALSLFVQVMDALAYAHEQGVVHRDIKPGNILVDSRSNRPYLADFGIASVADGEVMPSDFILGTPLYIAPEQLTGHEADARSDIYSSGLVIFELLAGALPLQTAVLDQVIHIKKADPWSIFTKRPSEARPAVGADLEKVILKAIDPDPQQRYQSCRSFHKDLSECMKRIPPGS